MTLISATKGQIMRRAIWMGWLLLSSAPSLALPRSSNMQDDEYQPLSQSSPVSPTPVGRVADTGVGEVGQRQTRDQTNGIKPMARLATRIQNRVQLRLSTRIDRDYDPQADATSLFSVAEEQGRTATRPR